MHFLVDLLILAIIGFCVWQGMKRGILGGILAIAFILIAVYGGNLVANNYSDEFTTMFRPFVSGYLDRVEVEVMEEFVPENLSGFSTEDLFRLEPGMETVLIAEVFTALGVHESRVYKLTDRYEAERDEGLSVNRSLTNVLVYAFCFVLVFVVGFLLIVIALTVIYNIIPFSFRIPRIKLIDKIGGGVLGGGQGLLLVFMLTWLLGYLGLLLPEDLIENSFLTGFFIRFNPMTNHIDI